MVVGLGVCGAGGDRDFADEGVRAEVAGKNRSTLQGVQYMSYVQVQRGRRYTPGSLLVGPRTRPYTSGKGGRAKDK